MIRVSFSVVPFAFIGHSKSAMGEHTDIQSVADIVGPWVDPNFDSGLVNRCRLAWEKPLRELTNDELATFLRQRIAIEHILPVAEARLKAKIDDDTEIYDGELYSAVQSVSTGRTMGK